MSDTNLPRRPLAYAAYQELADHYAAGIEVKPHNAYYERPAMLAMWPEVAGKKVLDAGCGPGIYSQILRERGANVTSVDASERMLEHARRRLGSHADLRLVDLSQPLVMFDDEEFDVVNAPLCLDYIEDWLTLFSEFHRILKRSGILQFSCGHPAFDAEYYGTNKYFEVEQVECIWTGFGKSVVMPSYRRSLQEVLMPLIHAGFMIRQIVEPLPTKDFAQADRRRFESLKHRPCFLCVQAFKGS